jgi:hypothetical protein
VSRSLAISVGVGVGQMTVVVVVAEVLLGSSVSAITLYGSNVGVHHQWVQLVTVPVIWIDALVPILIAPPSRYQLAQDETSIAPVTISLRQTAVHQNPRFWG